MSIEELQQYGDQLLSHCLREDEVKRQARAEPTAMTKIAPTISPSTIKEAPPDLASQNEYQNKPSSKAKGSINSNDSDPRPRMTSNNTDTSPKWANGRYLNSMRNVDTHRHHDSDDGEDNKTSYHRTSETKYHPSSTQGLSASRRLDALLDASLTSPGDKRSPAADVDRYLPTPPNSVSPQFQSHQVSSSPGIGFK